MTANKKLEISKDEFFRFLKAWMSDKKIDLNIEQLFELIELVSDCYDDKMMFDSWFRGINVMD